jgi:hypothetical protein
MSFWFGYSSCVYECVPNIFFIVVFNYLKPISAPVPHEWLLPTLWDIILVVRFPKVCTESISFVVTLPSMLLVTIISVFF